MTHVDTPSFAIKTNLANLKNDKLGIKKLVPVPTDLSNLRNVVKIDVVKETVYDKLVSELFDLIAQIMSTPCASETILSSSTSCWAYLSAVKMGRPISFLMRSTYLCGGLPLGSGLGKSCLYA